MLSTVGEAYDAYLFDLDGTIYLGDELLPGAATLLEGLRERGAPVRFVSNNATRSISDYVDKLDRLGVPVRPDEVVNSVVVMVRWLEQTHPGAVVFPIAEPPLVVALEAAGFTISEDPSEIDVVIASYDRTLTYGKLQVAFDALWMHRRAVLVATNMDRYCPYPGGRGEPDAAAVVAAIEACTGVTLLKNVGKPDPAMAEVALAGLGLDLSRCVMVGDRLETDVRLAVSAGMASAMVLTGDSTRAQAAALPRALRPTYVLERIDELLPR